MTFAQWRTRCAVDLSPEQEAAVQAVDGAVLLLAVPGSGKTTVLLHRLSYLVTACGVPPEQILTVTYTVAATRELAARCAALLGPELAGRLAFHTINGLSARILWLYERTRGREAFRLVTDERVLSALVADLAREGSGAWVAENTVRALRTAITYRKNMLRRAEHDPDETVDGIAVGPLFDRYCAALRERGWMDYDDQMVYALRILRRCPDLLARLRERYRWLCVDEAQDTSRIQHEIVRLLAAPHGALFMVGDEDQSIYGFRAAWPRALLSFEKVWPGARVLKLETNRRSTRPIVAAADAFIRQNEDRRDKHMTAARGDGPPIRALWVWDRAEQYQRVAELARTCRRETAVLYRNNESALPVLDLLDRQGVRCRCRQLEGTFFTHRTVRDVADALALAGDPADGAAFLRLYPRFHAGITKGAAQWVVQQGTPILPLLAQTPGLSERTQERCRRLAEELSALRTDRADRAIRRLRRLLSIPGAPREPDRLDILEVLGRQEPDLASLMARLAVLRDLVRDGGRDRADEGDGALVLSTIHSSKGLEFEEVVLMDVLDGILPACGPPGRQADAAERAAYEEERRLFYVAMTRAKDRLTVFRFREGGLESRFARDTFGDEPRPAARPFTPAPKPGRARSGPRPDPVVFRPGTRVRHARFGPGEVVGHLSDIVTILFDSGEEKRFSLSVALRQGQLTRDPR